MKNIFLKVLPVLFAAIFLFVGDSFARENVTDWYIQDFSSEIVVNKDSSLDITETITADCGQAVGKHGIFRVLPEKVTVEGRGEIETPIELISIKDLNGNNYKYTASKNFQDKTITWKIGDADKTVQGINVYVIKYRVKNTIRFWNDDFDELYWNLTGNFWDLEIDKVHIEVKFPEEIKNDEVAVSLYSGTLGARDSQSADFYWDNDANLIVDSNRKLARREGITVSVTFAKNIFTPYMPTFWEEYGNYLFLIIPFMVFIICFRIWKNYGDDPDLKKTVIAEYKPPENMSPTEMGLLLTNGKLKNHFITAEIINFAVKGIITIKEVENKILFFTSKDYELLRVGNTEAESKLVGPQKIILDKIFEKSAVVKISSLKNNFYKILADIKKDGNKLLEEKNLIVAGGLKYSAVMIFLGFVLFFSGLIWGSAFFGAWVGLPLAISGSIILIFGFIMPKRTLQGTEMNLRIKGFKLFMKTVDKDRAKFYEEENIFEKFLPYAILFAITDIWIKRIKEIYGEEYFANHVPAWYIGNNPAGFNADSFGSALNELSNSISSSTSAPSGSGGGGSAGGGGGGGGGGGW